MRKGGSRLRNALPWVVGTISAAALLSAVIAVLTVQLYAPPGPAVSAPAPAPATTTAPAPAATAPAPAATTPDPSAAKPSAAAAPRPSQGAAPSTVKAGSPEEQVVLDLFRLASAGDMAGALKLTAGLTEESLKSQVYRHTPTVARIAHLPSPAGTTRMLVWVEYRLPGLPTRGLYDVTVQKGKVTAITGPLTPEGGYARFALQPQDEQGRPVDLNAYAGRALLLFSPRAPEPGLAALLTSLQATYGPRGIDVVLVLDIRSPDWLAAARQGGWQGPVWRVKARLEDVPLVSRANLLGAYGVLVDREGYAVASAGVLDPLRYGLPDQTPLGLAEPVLKAYGLLP
jgi:hypothetical protein